MIGNQLVAETLLTLLILIWGEATWASFDVLSNETVHLEIKGYDGLNGITLFRGELAPGIKQNVATSYRGLALLLFAHGQVYPVIVGNQPFLLMISNPSAQPSFTGSEENAYLYSNSHFVSKRALLNGIEGFIGCIGGCVTHIYSVFSARMSPATCFLGPLGSFRAH